MDNAFGRAYVDYMFQYIFDKVDNDIKVNIEEKNLEIIKETIKKEIFIKCFKSLLYCMNMARVNNELCGASAEERYSYFCNNKDLMIADMERMFPEMRNQVDREVRKKLIYLVRVVADFENNKNNIFESFLGENDSIKSILTGGDWHNNKSVVVIEFSKGNKIVFKPTHGKNIDFVKGVAELFFEKEYSELYKSLETEEGTWVKYIEHSVVEKEYDIKTFYYNYGKLLYMSYLLGINDMHYENLIAHGVFPVITDVETIFSSFLFFSTHRFDYNAQNIAVKKLLYGTMATGMVPIFTMTDYFGGDVSCLSNKGLKISVEKLKNEYRDDMYVSSQLEIVRNDSHMPNPNINPLLYCENIVEGFDSADMIFRKNSKRICEYIGSNLEKVESRIILNMTKAYSKILRIRNDVKYRMNPELFEKLLGNLKRANQFDKQVYEHEVAELTNGNIPSFYWNVKYGFVYGLEEEDVKKIMPLKTIDKTSIIKIIEYQTDEKQVQEQRRLIKDAIISNIVLGIEYYSDKKINNEEIFHRNNEDVDIRVNVDKNIILGGDDTITWIGLQVNDHEQLEYALLDWSLYSGVTGIGLMYYSEWLVNGDSSALTVIQKIINTIKIEYDRGRFADEDVSYYCGMTGIYSFIKKVEHISEINTYGLNEKIEALIISNIEKTNCYDTLSGIHSAVLYFYSCYKEYDFPYKLLKMMASYFLENFDASKMEKQFNYASFAHGYAGIITSLFCMYRITKDQRFIAIIKQLWKKEKELRLNNYNWIDKRRNDNSSSHFWCHGSCGIMHAYLMWYKNGFLKDNIIDITDSEVKDELSGYKVQIEKKIFDTMNYSLCHGNFALIDFLISYCKETGEEINEKYIDEMLSKAKEEGYSCIGAPGAINALGFMVGEAGIKYLLNRYTRNDIRSILLCENI